KVIDADFTAPKPLSEHLENSRRDYILSAMETTNWNFTKAAESLGISRVTLHKYMKELGLAEITIDPL
ncbi:MAG: helix-turn-helix domain-containing protein, partial [Deltaproteobacteria bacterium]|nr:helix-turn-helix domain-containing protein [Deltaproteobacteria bacterium]